MKSAKAICVYKNDLALPEIFAQNEYIHIFHQYQH